MFTSPDMKSDLLKRPFFIPLVFFLAYLLAALVPILLEMTRSQVNNYQIFKKVYFHTRAQVNLYSTYPALYSDSNHYGIFFSLLIAPFALLPGAWGVVLWTVANSLVLWLAILQLPSSLRQRSIIWSICLNDVVTSSFSAQINPLIAALFLFSFTAILKKHEFLAALFIFSGAFVKLYTLVGLAWIFISARPYRFLICCLATFIVLLYLPAAISSLNFVFESYGDWYHSLVAKNAFNRRIFYNQQDFSVMGMVRRVSHNQDVPDLPFIATGALLYFIPFFRKIKRESPVYCNYLLASALIFPVIFSTSSESPTYIIAMTGVAVWYAASDKSWKVWNLLLLVLAVIFTSLSPTDIFSRHIRDEFFIKYSVKAFPCTLVWLSLIAELIFRKFDPAHRISLFAGPESSSSVSLEA